MKERWLTLRVTVKALFAEIVAGALMLTISPRELEARERRPMAVANRL